MTWIVDGTTGDITCRCGDTGNYVIENITILNDGKAYFALYNKETRKQIGDQISTDVYKGNTVIEFFIPKTLTDLLTVPTNEESKDYGFGIKLCYTVSSTSNEDEEGVTEEHEETIVVGNKAISDDNTITVLPKTVEGED